jgi:hypothetical protein
MPAPAAAVAAAAAACCKCCHLLQPPLELALRFRALLTLLLLLGSAPAVAAPLLLLLSKSDAQPITYVLKLLKALPTLTQQSALLHSQLLRHVPAPAAAPAAACCKCGHLLQPPLELQLRFRVLLTLLLLLLSKSDAQSGTDVLKLLQTLTTLNSSRRCCILNCPGTCQRLLLLLLLLLDLDVVICCSRQWSFNCAFEFC